MQRDARAYLWDIRESADSIQSFIAGVDHARVWRIAHASLPGLRAMAAALLDELGPA